MTESALIVRESDVELSPVAGLSADQNPVLVYLASLGSAGSRRVMRRVLNLIADLLFPGRFMAPERPAKLPKGSTAAAREAHRAAYRSYRQAVEAHDTRCEYTPWQNLRFQHTAAIRAALSERYKFTTANNALSALRGVLKTAADLGLMSADDCRAACNALKVVKGSSEPAGRDIIPDEIRALSTACKKDKTPAGARDVAIIGVLYACGMRRAELAALTLANYVNIDAAAGALKIERGKGKKERTVYITNGAKLALDAWLVHRGTQDGPLFVSINKGGQLTGKGMTAQAVYLILQKRAKQAGIEKKFSPHDFRRTYVGNLLNNGEDIVTVQKMAGHASPTTTARYDRRPVEKQLKAAKGLSFPF